MLVHKLNYKFIAGFEQAIQGYAIHVLSLTYQKIPRTVLAEVCFWKIQLCPLKN
jgi:hypothetical protein